MNDFSKLSSGEVHIGNPSIDLTQMDLETLRFAQPLKISFVPKEDITVFELAVMLSLMFGNIYTHFYEEKDFIRWLEENKIPAAIRHVVIEK